MGNKYLVIDFDSTFVRSEGLEELAAIALRKNPEREKILNEIREITNLGMAGNITFRESLSRRLPLLRARREHVEELAENLRHEVTPSIARHKDFFRENTDSIIILSGGFQDFMLPTTNDFYIKPGNVYGNKFMFDANGNIVGFNRNNCLTEAQGKVKLLNSLNLSGEIIVLGDGWTDYEMKDIGPAKYFYVLSENVCRLNIAAVADKKFINFDDFLAYITMK